MGLLKNLLNLLTSNSKKSQPKPSISIQTTPSWNSHSNFCSDAKRYLRKTQRSANFVPLHSYWTTYSHMNANQQNWYFYWRSHVRDGKYLPTSASYIYLHVYELINGFAPNFEPSETYVALKNIWLHYRNEHQSLDNHLPDWIVDFHYLQLKTQDPLSIYSELFANVSKPRKHHKNFALQRKLPDNWGSLSITDIESLINYSIQRSKFYEKPEGKVLDGDLPRILKNIDDFYRSKGSGLIKEFGVPLANSEKREIFQGAISCGKPKYITIGDVRDYVGHRPLNDFLTSVVKYSENILRQAAKHRGKLQHAKLPPEIAEIIERTIGGDENPFTIVNTDNEFAIIQVNEEEQTSGIVIPPRNEALSNRPERNADLDRLIAKGYFRDGWNVRAFVRKMRDLADLSAEEYPFTGYSSWYGSYGQLSPDQLNYYFYWRTEVRKEQYLSTDTGYLYIYIAELLHEAGTESSLDALNKLQKLWGPYHENHDIIRRLLPRCSADFIVANKLNVHPLSFYCAPEIIQHTHRYHKDLVISALWKTPVQDWPLEAWVAISNYKINKSKFLTQIDQDDWKQHIPIIMREIDRLYKSSKQNGILKQFQIPSHSLKRPLFQYDFNATLGSTRSRKIATVYELSKHAVVNAFIGNLLKEIENRLRQVHGYKHQLKTNALPIEVLDIINSQIVPIAKPVPPKPQVKLDIKRLEELAQESDEIFDLLHIEEDQSQPEIFEPAPQKTVATTAKEPPQTNGSDLFEDEEWNELADHLQPIHLQTLQIVVAQDQVTEKIQALAKENNTMPLVLLGEINEFAQDTIEDTLIETDPVPYIYDEDYLPYIQQLLTRK